MELDDAIRQLWTRFHDPKSGKTKWKAMADELNKQGVKTPTGAAFTKDNLWTYVKRHKPVEIRIASRRTVEATADTPPQTPDAELETVTATAPLPPKQTEQGRAVSHTVSIPPKQLHVGTERDLERYGMTEVSDTADTPPQLQPGTLTIFREGEPISVLAMPTKDWLTLLEMLEQFRTRSQPSPRQEELPPVQKRFPETLPSYAGKAKDSLSLVLNRWKLALERAQTLWPNQKIEKGNFAQWLVERFLEETADLATEGSDEKEP